VTNEATATTLPPHAAVPVELPERFADLPDLGGRCALVTGGGRGLGLAISCALAQAGARVAISGRHASYLAAAVDELEARGAPEPFFVEGDVAQARVAAETVREAAARLGGLDILVNNAGSGVRKPPQDLTVEEFDRIFATNVRGPYFASCAALDFVAKRRGAIVNIASLGAYLPVAELAAYCASKAALVQLTRALAAEWGHRGVRVNAVAPGFIDSPLNAHRKENPEQVEWIVGGTPLGRWGLPADVAHAVVTLASDGGAFITGQTLVVDGGFSLIKGMAWGQS
jgi:NAD(P)-dependent dehydrogenase (short-subunit alcohol dehydrogenase family)